MQKGLKFILKVVGTFHISEEGTFMDWFVFSRGNSNNKDGNKLEEMCLEALLFSFAYLSLSNSSWFLSLVWGSSQDSFFFFI